MKRGKLIVFEGVDGGGKSTQLRRAAAALRARGLDILETGEPTKGLWGRKIREMARTTDRVPRETELAWFIKDRREHMRDTVGPALAAGRIVLCDRSYFSTVAYQGARGFDPAKLLAESQAEFGRPDLVLLDYSMPELDGEQVLTAIRADPRLARLPVLLAAASSIQLDQVPRASGFLRRLSRRTGG